MSQEDVQRVRARMLYSTPDSEREPPSLSCSLCLFLCDPLDTPYFHHIHLPRCLCAIISYIISFLSLCLLFFLYPSPSFLASIIWDKTEQVDNLHVMKKSSCVLHQISQLFYIFLINHFNSSLSPRISRCHLINTSAPPPSRSYVPSSHTHIHTHLLTDSVNVLAFFARRIAITVGPLQWFTIF